MRYITSIYFYFLTKTNVNMELLEQWYWIMPNKVLFDKDLKWFAKSIFVVVSSLCSEKWYCRASNEYVANVMWVSEKTVSRSINELVDKWYIHSQIDKNNGNRRVLTLSPKLSIPMDKIVHTYGQNCPDINIIDKYKYINYLNNVETQIQTQWENALLEERKEKSCEKKKRKKVEYTENFETLRKIYPQNWWVKEKIFKIRNEYSDEKKSNLVFWAKLIRLRNMTWWKYVQRMDRWMEWYEPPTNELEKLKEAKREVDKITNAEEKNKCYEFMKEMFWEELFRQVARATAQSISFNWVN
mgnify:CR=1 FL=1